MSSEILFTIAGKTGCITLDGLRRPEFINHIQEIRAERRTDFNVDIRSSSKPAFNLEITDPRHATFFISISQVLRSYGYMTIFKALLQGMLMDEGIILLHGVSDKAGNITISGTETGWYDALVDKPSKYERLVVVRKQKNSYYIHRDFLKRGHNEGSTEVSDLKTPQGLTPDIELLFRSTWFYFFFSHFFARYRREFLPKIMGEALKTKLVDFASCITYNEPHVLHQKQRV